MNEWMNEGRNEWMEWSRMRINLRVQSMKWIRWKTQMRLTRWWDQHDEWY